MTPVAKKTVAVAVAAGPWRVPGAQEAMPIPCLAEGAFRVWRPTDARHTEAVASQRGKQVHHTQGMQSEADKDLLGPWGHADREDHETGAAADKAALPEESSSLEAGDTGGGSSPVRRLAPHREEMQWLTSGRSCAAIGARRCKSASEEASQTLREHSGHRDRPPEEAPALAVGESAPARQQVL